MASRGDDEPDEALQVPLGDGETTFTRGPRGRIAQLRALQAAIEAGEVQLDAGAANPKFAAPPWHPDHMRPDE